MKTPLKKILMLLIVAIMCSTLTAGAQIPNMDLAFQKYGQCLIAFDKLKFTQSGFDMASRVTSSGNHIPLNNSSDHEIWAYAAKKIEGASTSSSYWPSFDRLGVGESVNPGNYAKVHDENGIFVDHVDYNFSGRVRHSGYLDPVQNFESTWPTINVTGNKQLVDGFHYGTIIVKNGGELHFDSYAEIYIHGSLVIENGGKLFTRGGSHTNVHVFGQMIVKTGAKLKREGVKMHRSEYLVYNYGPAELSQYPSGQNKIQISSSSPGGVHWLGRFRASYGTTIVDSVGSDQFFAGTVVGDKVHFGNVKLSCVRTDLH